MNFFNAKKMYNFHSVFFSNADSLDIQEKLTEGAAKVVPLGMEEFMTGGGSLMSSTSKIKTEKQLNDSGEFPDLLDSENSLANLNSNFNFTPFTSSSEDKQLDTFLKSAESIKIESGLTFTDLNGLKPEYPDIDVTGFEALQSSVVVAKKSSVHAAEVKDELEVGKQLELDIKHKSNMTLQTIIAPSLQPKQPYLAQQVAVRGQAILPQNPIPPSQAYVSSVPRGGIAPSLTVAPLNVTSDVLNSSSVKQEQSSAPEILPSIQQGATNFPRQYNPSGPASTVVTMNSAGSKTEVIKSEKSEDIPELCTTPTSSIDDRNSPLLGSSNPGTPTPGGNDPSKDTFTLVTASGSKVEVPTIITGGYDFDNLLCLFCDNQQFKNDKTLVNHMLNHFGVAPKMATCPVCGLQLQKKSFARHVRLHGDYQPEVCPYCKKEFREKRSLDKHVRAIHEAERPFPCDHCSESFRNPIELKAHINRHLKDHPYKCDICSFSFQKQEALTTHYRLHTGEKPFACAQCDKKFTSEKNRRVHMLRHEGSLPHKCEICDMTFQSRSHLLKHATSHNRKTQVTVAKINTFLESFGASLGEFGLDDTYDSSDQISLHPATESGEIEDQSIKLSMETLTETETLETAAAEAAMSFDVQDDVSVESDSLEDVRKPTTFSPVSSIPSVPSLVNGLSEEDAERMARAELATEIPATTDGTHLCQMCNTRLGNKRSYIIHLRRHAGMLNFKCNYCPKTFQGKVKLNRHVNTHFKDGAIPTSTSVPNTQTRPEMTGLTKDPGPPDKPGFICNLCGKHYGDKASLQEHTKMHLIEDAKAKFSTAAKEKKVKISVLDPVVDERNPDPF